MGREIVYCESCGDRLTEDDFTRGKAQDHGGRPFCSGCRPVVEETPAPPPEKNATDRRLAGTASTSRRRKVTERVPFAQPPPAAPAPRPDGSSNVGLFVGIGLAVTVILIVAAATTGRRSDPPPEEPVTVRPPVEIRPPAVDPAEERRREQEALREKERLAALDRALASIRKIMQDDPACARRAEVEALIDAALKDAGTRSGEVRRLQSEYLARCEEAAKRKAAEKPAPRKWSEVFVLATNRIQANDYPGAKALYLEGLATLPPRRPEELQPRALYCIGLYNLACIYAVEAPKLADARARGQALDEAFKYLDWALRSDYGKFRCSCHPQTLGLGHIADDKDMDPLRADPRYAPLLQKHK